MRLYIILVVLMLTSFSAKAQYSFTGHIDTDKWQNNVYLSIVDDYRKMSGVYSEQIIAKVKTDSLGFFKFKGNQLENENRIYRIHVDNCFTDEQNKNHFTGHCTNSREVIFIAKNSDTIKFPFSFDDEMFCTIESNNKDASVFVKIDLLKEEMKFAFSEYRSEANRKLNNKKWFKTLQDFGQELNEPIADLYIYSFLSDRGNVFHEYYLEDLKVNLYYDNLLDRLSKTYPKSPYTKQYKAELTSDKYIINTASEAASNWNYLLYFILGASLLGNIWFFINRRKNKTKVITDATAQLTKQEQNVLALLLEEKSNKEIASILFVSLSTVKTHINNIYKKLNVQSRDEIKALFNS